MQSFFNLFDKKKTKEKIKDKTKENKSKKNLDNSVSELNTDDYNSLISKIDNISIKHIEKDKKAQTLIEQIDNLTVKYNNELEEKEKIKAQSLIEQVDSLVTKYKVEEENNNTNEIDLNELLKTSEEIEEKYVSDEYLSDKSDE